MTSRSSSDYEQWIVALRKWRTDPLTDMSGLPAITDETFPPATLGRFVGHLNEALNEFMQRWDRQLAGAMKSCKEPHDLARALVDARVGLAHRMRLARHPAFPEVVRTQLVEQATTNIRSLQRELEESAANAANSSSAVRRTERDETLRIFRENALTAVLDPNFTADPASDPVITRADRAIAELASDRPQSDGHRSSSAFRRIPRRVIIQPNEG